MLLLSFCLSAITLCGEKVNVVTKNFEYHVLSKFFRNMLGPFTKMVNPLFFKTPFSNQLNRFENNLMIMA